MSSLTSPPRDPSSTQDATLQDTPLQDRVAQSSEATLARAERLAEAAAEQRNAPEGKSAAKPAPKPWLLNGPLDLLFVINITWPAVALFTAMFAKTAANEAFGFMLVYFVIMPHRWITLPLVFADREKFSQRPVAYLGVLAGIVLLCSSIKLGMESLALLVAIDYIWNAWHFAAQHGGIYRIYCVATPDGRATSGQMEKYLLRTFFLFTLLRLTGLFLPEGSEGWLGWAQAIGPYVAALDFVALGIPAFLIGREVVRFKPGHLGRLLYVTSICSLYATLLLAVRYDAKALIIGCAAATTLVHSSEYLAIVSWYAPKRSGFNQSKVWGPMMRSWGVSLVAFMSIFAISAYFLRNSEYLPLWLWININVSLLHYAYDGMIWKRPKKKPAPAAA